MTKEKNVKEQLKLIVIEKEKLINRLKLKILENLKE